MNFISFCLLLVFFKQSSFFPSSLSLPLIISSLSLPLCFHNKWCLLTLPPFHSSHYLYSSIFSCLLFLFTTLYLHLISSNPPSSFGISFPSPLSLYPFSLQDTGGFQTSGVDMVVTSERIILLDTQVITFMIHIYVHVRV